MIKYKLQYGKISRVEVISSTPKFYVLANGIKELKDGSYYKYYDTFEMALVALLLTLNTTKETLVFKLSQAQELLDVLNNVKTEEDYFKPKK